MGAGRKSGRSVRAGRSVRLARRWRLDRNPLRRRWDRVETWIMAALLALFLAGVPLAWLGVGRWVHQTGLREQRAQRAWHEIPGVVLRGTPSLSRQMFRMPMNTTAQVLTAWAGPRSWWLWVPRQARGCRSGWTAPAGSPARRWRRPSWPSVSSAPRCSPWCRWLR
jgi:hypothetical protein